MCLSILNPVLWSVFTLAGCVSNPDPASPAGSPRATPYPDLGPAPELANDTWLNTWCPCAWLSCAAKWCFLICGRLAELTAAM